jgi:ABC-2 type transport system ATP-binding protein
LGRRIAVLAVGIAALALPASAAARDVTVTSFDDTPISAHFFPADGLAPGAQAPTVLVGPGWSMSGETDPNSTSNPVLENFGLTPIGVFIHNGFNVMTWDPRGFGASGGTVEVDDYRYEGRDVQALIDYVAQQPEAQLDSPGDPRVGMAGSSYGGIIQLVTAAIDSRVDAIVPNITPHDYTSSLFKEHAVKAGWGLALVGVGIEGSVLPGLLGFPPQTGHMDPHIYDTIVGGVTNSVSDENYQWFADKGPGFLVKNIHVPTLLTQGTADTLFTPQEAIDNFSDLAAHSGAPLKMMWFCGGHGVCLTGSGPSGYVADRTVEWLDRYLKGDTSVDTGPRFEWLAEDDVWRSAADYPMKSVGSLEASGPGTLPIAPVPSGALILATPAALPGTSAELTIPGPAQAADVVGAPQLTLTYSGTALPAKTFVYAQIVNSATGQVQGNQATPIPVDLDGTTHTISRPLEPIASRAAPGQSYKLQIVPATTLYGLQTSLGLANFSDMHVELPVVDAAGTSGPAPAGGIGTAVSAQGGAEGAKSKGSKKKCARRARKANRGKKRARAIRRCAKRAAT